MDRRGTEPGVHNPWNDPFVWKEGRRWYMLLNSSTYEEPPHVHGMLLYESVDLID